jgi:hypothetical protein
LALFNGQDGRPLTYIIRKDPIPPMEATDPAFGQAGARFGIIRDEIEARAPHDTPEYHVDNATVFDILNDAVGDHKNVKTWIKSFARMKDGRSAWESFKNHYRGTNQMEAMEADAEKQLSTLTYTGEKPRYNFELHVSKHLQAHLDIAKAGGDMRERSKVRKLLSSLQAKHLEAAIAYVRGNDQLQENFDRAVSYIRTFIIATTNTETRNVASVQGSNKRVRFEDKKDNKNKNKKSKKDKKGGKKDSDGEDRFYKPKEWWALSKEKRDRIIAIRDKRNAQTSAVVTETTATVSSVQTSQRH